MLCRLVAMLTQGRDDGCTHPPGAPSFAGFAKGGCGRRQSSGLLLHHSVRPLVNSDSSLFSVHITAETAPCPLIRFLDQSTLHQILVLDPFVIAVNIEIVEAFRQRGSLIETTRSAVPTPDGTAFVVAQHKRVCTLHDFAGKDEVGFALLNF